MEDRSGNALHRLTRVQDLRALHPSVAGGHRPVQCRVEGKSTRVGVELDRIEVPAVFVRLPAVEDRALELESIREQPGGNDTEADMRGILPVVTQRGKWDIHRRGSMHEGHRTEGGFAGRTTI